MLLGASQAATVPAPYYKVTQLQHAVNGTGWQKPNAINNAGQVAGQTGCCYSLDSALWVDGQVTLLNTSGHRQNYELVDINNAGQILGRYYYSGSFDSVPPATAWRVDGVPGVELITLGYSVHAINDAGQVLTNDGSILTSTGAVLSKLGTLGGTRSSTQAINNLGVVVGSSQLAGDTTSHAALWNGPVATDLGTLGGTSSAAYGINDEGVVVGESQVAGNAATRAVRWNGTTMTDLGTLGGMSSRATAINKGGTVVGFAETADGVKHATVWNGNTAIDLNSHLSPDLVALGTVLTEARGINDEGQIIVSATQTNMSFSQGFVLSPSLVPVVVVIPGPACSASYKVTNSNFIGFTAQVTVANLSNAPLTGWSVAWTYSAKPFILGSKNAKITTSGTSLTAVPLAANQTIAAKSSTVFTFTSLKGKLVPSVSGMSAALGGKTCTSTVE